MSVLLTTKKIIEEWTDYNNHMNLSYYYKLEMYNKAKNTLSATTEVLSLYIDLNIRKVVEIEEEKKIIMDNFINKNKSQFKSDNLKFLNKLKKIS